MELDQVPVIRPRKLHLVRVITLILISAIIITAIIIWNRLQQPGTGTIKTKAPPSAESESQPITYKLLNGKTFSLEYPSNYSAVAMGAKGSYTGLDNIVLATSNIAGNDHIAIAVAETQGPLVSDSSFRYRQLHPELYKQTTRQLGGSTIYLFTKTDGGYEQTVFIPYQDVLATIALTSTRIEESEHAGTMDHMLQTLRWHLP